MSKVHQEHIECPRCHTVGTAEILDVVDADLNPELRERVLTANAFIYTCPECGAKILVGNSLLYHDESHRFLIFFDLNRHEEYDYQPLELSDELLAEYPDYTFRYVAGLYDLKEKITILENGLNDVAIERMKYMTTHYSSPEIGRKGYKLRFLGVDPDDKEASEYGSMHFFHYDKNKEMRQGKFSMDLYYQYCLAVKLDPRMKPNGCVMVDEGWISRQLKGGAL